MIPSTTTSNPSCGCGSNQRRSTVACPSCHQQGVEVKLLTPQHTLKKRITTALDPTRQYHFCENPACDAVYYSGAEDAPFTTADLKNRVTLKDDSPETPLCYCFKVLKRQALEEIARTGTTDVMHTIQNKMRPGQSCFCEKSNPRGDCCTTDIAHWLQQQGIEPEQTEPCDSGCCG